MRENLSANETVVIASSPCVSDILGALYLCEGAKRLGVVYFHHLVAPPWKFPMRRGGLIRVSIVWILQTLHFALAKIGNLLISLDQPSEVSKTGWRIENTVVRDQHSVSIPSEMVDTIPKEAKYDACFLGRIHAQKGILDLVKIWGKVVERFPKAKLAIAGSAGPDNFGKRLNKAIRREGLTGSIVILGSLDEKSKWALLRQSKLMVLASYEEGWSLSVMEAAACQTPTVCYDLPAYDYMQDSIVKVRIGDTNSAALQVIALLRNESYRKQMGLRARNMVSRYVTETIARNQLRIFKEFLDSRRAGS